MTTQEFLASSIPTMVSIDEEVNVLLSPQLQYGVATPGTMATTASKSPSFMSSPFGMFASFALSSSRALFDPAPESTDPAPASKKPAPEGDYGLGISAPTYGSDNDSVTSTSSNRIGIQRTDYQIPDGDIPLSPLDPFFKKKSVKKQKNDGGNDSDDGQDLWQLKLQQQANNMHADVILEDGPLEPDDSVKRLLHKQTSEGHYLVNSRPLDAPMEGLKYSLTDGKSAMRPLHRMASDSRVTRQKTRPNVTRSASAPINTEEEGAASFKIFMLLVAPRSKIFEIIQVFYSPLQTTVYNLLERIPDNATEPALGSQEYTGLCRLDGKALELDMMASASSPESECAKIIQGEILVATPKGYSAHFCSQIAKPILSNPKVTKLLNKSDPLAPSKKKKKKRKSSRKYKSIEVKQGNGGENQRSSNRGENQRSSNPYTVQESAGDDKERLLLKKALQRGAAEAESTNASVVTEEDSAVFANDNDTVTHQHVDFEHVPMDMWQTQMSFRSDSSCASSVDSFNNFASPVSARRSYFRPDKRSKESPAPVPEAPFESPTLGLDVVAPPPLFAGNEENGAAATLQTQDVNGAIAAFSKILSGMGSAENEAIMAQLVQAVQQNQMER